MFSLIITSDSFVLMKALLFIFLNSLILQMSWLKATPLLNNMGQEQANPLVEIHKKADPVLS